MSSADVLDGGAGTDTLRYASSSSSAVTESGFESKNIEIVQVTSDTVGGTTFDVSGVVGATTIRNFNSSQDLTFSGVKSIPTVELESVGSPDNSTTPNTTLSFTAAATAGSNTLNLNLLGNSNANGGAIGNVTANGIETIALTTSSASSSLAAIISSSMTKMTVAGDQNLTLGSVTMADTLNANVIDASTFTGNLVANNLNSGTVDIAVTGGTGNDTADFSAGFDKSDSFDGGEGTDTIGLSNATASGIVSTNAGTTTNVEQLNITTDGTGTIDMDNFSGVTKVIYDSALTAATTSTVDDAISGIEVEVDVEAQSTANLTVDLKTDGTADVVTLTFDAIAKGDALGTVNADDAETLNISADDDSTGGDGTFSITSLSSADATTINLSGDSDLTITSANVATPILTKLDASGMTGKTTLTAFDFSKNGATIMLGSADDTLDFTGSTASGGDTITLGGGKDKITYSSASQSQGANVDTITDFVSGTDTIDLQAIGLNTATLFLGNVKSFADATSALTSTALESVFVADENALFIDVNGDGQFGAADMQIELSGVTSIVAADLNLSSTGASVSLTAAGAVVNATTKTNATASTTTSNDTISGTVAEVNGITTLDGLAGTDTIIVEDAGAVTVPAGVTNTEALTLANGTNTVALTATSIKAITGGTGNDAVTVTNLAAGGAVSLGDGADSITAMTETIVEGTGSSFNGGGGTSDSLTFAAALTTANLDLSKVSGFETIDLGAVGGAVTTTAAKFASGVTKVIADTTGGAVTLNLTGAQASALTTITNTNGTGTFNITFADASQTFDISGDTIDGAGNIDVITFAGNNNKLVTGATNLAKIAAAPVAAGTGDILELTSDSVVAVTTFDAFEILTANGSAVDITDNAIAVVRTINGDSGNNIIDIGGNNTAAKTVNITSGGTDTVAIDEAGASTGVVTINGFTAGTGGDVIDVDDTTGVVAQTGIVIDGATATSAAAGAATDLLILGAADNQVGGALTATGDAGLVEAAIINAALVLAGQTPGQVFYVALDNGTDTGIYRVTEAATAGTAGVADVAADFSVALIGVLSGVADVNTLVAANIA